MRAWVSPILILVAAGVLAAVGAADDESNAAWRLGERESSVRLERIETMESAPPQFALRLDVAMPEPMWKLEVDSVSKPDAGGHIVVKLTGKRPEGNLPQVITMTPVRVNLGSIDTGDYLVEVFLSTLDRDHVRIGTVMLRATS